MNVHLIILLAAEIFSVFTEIRALPGWWWGSSSKHKYWNQPRLEGINICSVGQCIQAWKCPIGAVSNRSSDHCIHSNNGAMVCCVLNNPSSKSDDGSSEVYLSSEHLYNPRTSESINENRISTKSIDDYWNNKSLNKRIAISSGDIGKDSRDKIPSSHHDGYSNNPTEKAINIAIRNLRTTLSWNKPHTSDFGKVVPTESAWLSKTTGVSTFATPTSKKTFDNKITNSGILRSTLLTVATSGYFTKTTKRNNSAFTSKPRTTQTSTMAPKAYSTKRPLNKTELFTKMWNKATNNKSTNLSPRSTTLRYMGYTSKTTRRHRSTIFPYSTKTIEIGKVTIPIESTSIKPDSNRRQDWDKSTSTTNQFIRPTSTKKPRTTRSTKRGHRLTTPLPNVNIHSCGIRDERSFNRGRRNYEIKYNDNSDNIYSGRSSANGRQPYERIVGGEEVEPFSWPWVAALYKVNSAGGNRFLCAGSLINENFVLTAAHIFTPDDLRTASYIVMLGTHNAQDSVAQYLVSSIIRHPRYENRFYYHDIALLKLEKPVVFSNYVMPVCLPSPDAPLLQDRDLNGKIVTVMGWGDESFGGKSSRVLKEATFPVVSRTSCNASYVRVASNRFPKGITDSMLCAGDPNGGKDACQGDSGGPLTSIERGRYTQVGIVSFGYQCGNKEFPGVYTKVAPYLSWIAENSVCNLDYGNEDYKYY